MLRRPALTVGGRPGGSSTCPSRRRSSGKLRELGFPTLRDRVAQMALKLVLEPICEQSRVHPVAVVVLALCAAAVVVGTRSFTPRVCADWQ